jgi:S-adenosylmethionine hydrolase
MKPSGIITLTTDFGLHDQYVAVMKGIILSINPNAVIVDVTHDIPPGSLLQAAQVINDTVPYFPQGTVHVAVIDPGVGGARLPVAVETNECFFVGPDNGIFWPVTEKLQVTRSVHLTEKKYFLAQISNTFHGRDIFAPVAAYITLGHDIKTMGIEIDTLMKLQIPRPHTENNVLHGQIIRVDNFGNLITNIHQEELERFLESAPVHICIGDMEIHEIRRIYTSVSEGEPLALYGSTCLLEIAVNAGRATDLLGLKASEIVGMDVTVTRIVS